MKDTGQDGVEAKTRVIPAETVISAAARLCQEANYKLPEDVVSALIRAVRRERSALGRRVLRLLVKNAEIASQGQYPLCQDCGLAVFFVQLGSRVQVSGMALDEALAEGTRRGYREGFLRASVVSDPFLRNNTGDNTPPVVQITTVPGEALRIRFLAKGAGSENMSRIAMLSPTDGVDGVREFVVGCVRRAGANPCPPIVVGVGIGGSMERAAELAKLSLFRKLGSRHSDAFYRRMEAELLRAINRLGIGPAGLGGTVTALAVHILAAPCHIASLPVAVNIQCHSLRRSEVVL